MVENQGQGTKSSIELFDLDNGGNQEGLSDSVVVLNDFEIEQESDLTLQSTHIASDRTGATQREGYTPGGADFVEETGPALSRINVKVNDEEIAEASNDGKYAIVNLNLSEYISEETGRVVLRDLPDGVRVVPGKELDDGSVAVESENAENIVVVISPNAVDSLQLQIDILPAAPVEDATAETAETTETSDDETVTAAADSDFIVTETETEEKAEAEPEVEAEIEIEAVEEAANTGPDVSADTSFSMNEDGTITITEAQLLANASDADGDTLSVENLTSDNGTLVDNLDGTWTFTPDADFNGDVNLSYEVSDGEDTAAAAGSIDVAAVNDAATSEATSFTANEDGSITITEAQLLANASDIEGDDLSVQNLSADGGLLLGNGDGTWTFTPDADFNGQINLSYDISDGTDTTQATGTIEVADVNDAATVSGATSFTADEDNTIIITEAQLLENASDIDGNTLSVENLSADGGTLSDNGDGTWSFTPNADFNGDINLTYDVSDGTTTTPTSGTISVTAVNDAAEVSGPTEFDVSEDNSVTITEAQLLENATDIDGDDLSVQNLSADDGTLTDNGDGTWTFTPDANFNGEINLSYDVSDGTTTTQATGTIDVAAVNDAVDVSGDVSLTMDEDTTLTITESQLLANATDIEGGEMSIQNLSADGGTLTDNGDGTWSFTPDEDFFGEINLSYDVSDGENETAAGGTITINDVDEENTSATVSGPTSFTMNEDGSLTITEAQLLANATDAEGDDLSVVNLSVSNDGTLTNNEDGTWTFTPDDDFNGNVDLTYGVSDGNSTTNTTGSITVNAVNDAAEVSGPTSFDVDEDNSITITEAQLLENATDVEGDDLSVQNLSADDGTLVDNGNGTWTFTPDENFNGEINLSYDVSDGTDTTAATGTIDVAAVNDGPDVSAPTSFTMNEDGTLTITKAQLLANASDVDGDTLSIQNLVANGDTLTDNGDGSWTFTPNEDFNGQIDLSYDVSDGTDTTATTGSITVNAVNDAAEVSGPTSFDVDEDNSITITEAQLLENATDVEGDDLSVQNLSADDGTLVDNGNGTWTFTPDENFNGEINLSYDVSDGTDTTAATGTIDVAAVNDAATVTGEVTFSINEDSPVTISDAQLESLLLANASDVDGDDLSISNIVPEGGGDWQDNENGTWTFTPDENFNGDIDFTYDISDGTVTTQASGTLTINAINDGPEASADSATVSEDNDVTIDLTGNDSDIDGDTLSVTQIDGVDVSIGDTVDVGNGTVTLNADGTVTFSGDDDYSGTETFQYTVSDGTETTTATASVDVEGVADAASLTISVGSPEEVTISDGSGDTGTIDTSNYDKSNNGFTVEGRSVDSSGGLSSAKANNVDSTGGGFAVDGRNDGPDGQIGTREGTSEELIVSFDNDVSSATIEAGKIYMNEGGSGQHESGHYELYRDGVKVGEGDFEAETSSHTSTFEVSLNDGGTFDQIVFTAQDDGYSDYVINSIDYTEAGETTSYQDYPITLTVAETDSDGSETLSNVTLSDIPSDAILMVDGNEVTVSNGSASIASDNLDNVVLRVPSGSDNFDIAVSITSTESNGSSETSTATLSITDVPDASDASSQSQSNSNNGFGNGDQNAPGNSGNNNNAENASGNSGEDNNTENASDVTSSAETAISDAINDAKDTVVANQKVQGSNSSDEINGTDSADYIYSKKGDDKVYGEDGDDYIQSTDGQDELYGGDGDDALIAGKGDDKLFGGDGDDVLSGENNNDELDGGSGNDMLDGGSGDDKLYGGTGNDTMDGGDGKDELYGGDGDDVMLGGDGDDKLEGGDGNDIMLGGDGNDEMKGEDGDDTFFGGAGNDTMEGGDGDDLFYFGEGSGDDTVKGGDGGWMDTVHLENEDGTAVNEDDWTIELDSGSITEQADGYIELSNDAEGTITFSDGSELNFDGIEKFEW